MKKIILFLTILFLTLVIISCSRFSRIHNPSLLAEESKGSVLLPKRSTFELTQAFEKDGYEVDTLITYQGKRAIRAQSKIAFNYETGEPKVVYYLEGTGYQMGYLFGKIAHEEIEIMCTKFMNGIVPAFLKPGSVKPYKSLMGKLMIDLIKTNDKNISKVIPQELMNEMEGIVQGCKAVNPKTQVNLEKIFTLNVGVDFLLSQTYNIEGLWKSIPGITGANLKPPLFCNAFSVCNKATVDGKHYYGRDFMFPTANIFQDVACMIIYNPDPMLDYPKREPVVTVTAPGMVGAITAMNAKGLAFGVDMVPAGNINTKQPGLNSLLLVRHTAHYGSNFQKALQVIIHAPRGVPWLYSIAEAQSGRAAVLEAGAYADSLDFLSFPSKDLIKEGLLPSKEFLAQHDTLALYYGLKIRWDTYVYPDTFFSFNPGFFTKFDKPYDPEEIFGETAFIDTTFRAKAVPKGYYFAPQREEKPDLVLTTNMYINPSMRLCSMAPWTIMVSADHMDDSQWRYDALNRLLLRNYGKIDFQKARDIIDFLAPNGKYYTDFYQEINNSDYFYQIAASSDGKTLQVFGATSICDLTEKIIESHYGYFDDEWITISLENYLKE